MKIRLAGIMLWLLASCALFADDSYYSTLDTNNANFAVSLHHLILTHTNVTSDYTDFKSYVNEYASTDAGNGKRKVTCAYSGEEKLYTPDANNSFTWGSNGYSVEHTWCQSWMPDLTPAYGTSVDYHHLFPLNHNNANAVRNNHPLGITNTVTYQFLEGKLGKNEKNQTVYEPRVVHKGDAARALLYTAVCYNGKDSKDWTFYRLNNTILPGLSEGSMDLDVLLFWAQQDPPDAWERGKNDWVFAKQGNRNPFVDHPEWIKLINFNTLISVAPGTLAPEPTAAPQNFTGISTRVNAGLSWTEEATALATTTAYLIMANTTGTFSFPADGQVSPDDTDLSDGSAMVNVPASGLNTYLFGNLPNLVQYYFQIVPYSINGGQINYKTTGLASPVSATTGINPVPDSPLSFTAKTVRYNQVNLDWKKNSDQDIVVLAYSNTDVFGTPVNGTAYNVDDQIVGGGKVAYIGSVESFSHFNLTPATNYFYRLWSVSPTLNYSAAKTASAVTYDIADQVHLIPIRDRMVGFDTWLGNEIGEAGGSTNYYITMLANTSSMITPAIDFNFTNKQVKFKARTYGGTSGNSAEITVSVSNDDGVNWTVLGTRKPTSTSLVAMPAFNFSLTGLQGRIKFETLSAVKLPKGAGIDDIEITGYEYSSAIDDELNKPQTLAIKNYPNPFNPSTTISFTTKIQGLTKLGIYNIKGELVKDLINTQLNSGTHSVVFNGNNLASGIYFCRLSIGENNTMHKMILTK